MMARHSEGYLFPVAPTAEWLRAEVDGKVFWQRGFKMERPLLSAYQYMGEFMVENHVRSDPGSPPSALTHLGKLSWNFLGIAAAVAVVCALLVFLQLAVLPVVFGLLLTAVISPLARWIRKVKAPRPLAAALALCLALGVVCGLGTLFGVSIASEFSALRESVTEGYRALLNWIADAASIPRDELSLWVGDHVQEVKDSLASFNTKTFTRLASVVQGLTIAGLSLVFAWFFTWDGDKQFEGVVALLPKHTHKHMHAIGNRIWGTLSGYVQGVLLVATADALLLGLGLWIIGVPLVLPLMLLMFLTAFIPFVGPLIAGTMAGLVGLSEGGISMAAMAIGASFIVQQIEGNLLQPFIMSRAVELHPALVLVALTIGGIVGGLSGVFLAIPVAAALKTILIYVHEYDPEAPREVSEQKRHTGAICPTEAVES